MSNPDFIGQLITRASTAAGGDSKLARLLEVSPGNVSDWKNGRRSCPVADVALMAELRACRPRNGQRGRWWLSTKEPVRETSYSERWEKL